MNITERRHKILARLNKFFDTIEVTARRQRGQLDGMKGGPTIVVKDMASASRVRKFLKKSKGIGKTRRSKR